MFSFVLVSFNYPCYSFINCCVVFYCTNTQKSLYPTADNLWNVSNSGLLWIKLLCILLNMSFMGHMHSLLLGIYLGLGLLGHEWAICLS